MDEQCNCAGCRALRVLDIAIGRVTEPVATYNGAADDRWLAELGICWDETRLNTTEVRLNTEEEV